MSSVIALRSPRRHQRIALANPRDLDVPKDVYAVYEHLGLGLLAAVLRNAGYTVEIFDACARNWSVNQTVAKMLDFAPDFLGLSCTYRTYPDALELAKQMKANVDSIHVTFGGEHATYAAEEILSAERAIDSVVRGEGEQTLLELVRVFGEGADLGKVEGIHFQDGNGIHQCPDRRGIEDIDSIPFAARDTLEYCLKEGKTAAIGLLATRGCPWDCHFCNANRFLRLGGGAASRRRSPENVVDEIELLHDRYSPSGVFGMMYFYDAIFVYKASASKRWARRFADEMLARKLSVPFEIYARVDSFSEEDTELIELLKRAGLAQVFMGLESGSQETLDAFDKKATVDQNARALRLLAKHGIGSATNGFIMFNPYISQQGVRDSIEFLRSTGQASLWNMSQKLQLFPGTQIIDNLRKEGLLLPHYAHTEVYAYEFKHRELEPLANQLLAMNDEPVSTRENSLMRYISTTADLIYARVAETAGLSAKSKQELDRLKGEVEHRQREVRDFNCEFVLRLVDIAETGWQQPEFDALKGRYLESMSSRLDTASGSFAEFLGFVDEDVRNVTSAPARKPRSVPLVERTEGAKRGSAIQHGRR